ncbi:CMT1A duplicated region transcript 4 protein [Carettochelys insculpta]|uniref:CMT1A duplicated region transcript 4 protein n=1 Tax=Carettochelys insculpta TaxID=44489 RepID=UPI003EBB6605
MGVFLKEFLEPAQNEAFNRLTQMETAPASSFKSSLKEQSLFSANIGLPSPLICRCRRWPAYTTLTSPTVKLLVAQDELRKAGPQRRPGLHSSPSGGGHAPGQRPSGESQKASVTGTTQESVRPQEDSSPTRLVRGSPADTAGVLFQRCSASGGPPIKGNRLIFSSKPPFRVLPYGSQMSPSKLKSTACS